eukprot:scpid68912/ scgid2839/ Cytoplasmic dynein 2 light intermediate chain 1
MAQKLIWDVAATEHQAKEAARSRPKESVLLVIGSKNGGKSTIISRFAERTDERRPATGLEYTFYRKQNLQNLGKDVVHLWELGGGSSLADLLEVVVKPNIILNLSVVMVLDLSEPNNLWTVFEELMAKLREAVKSVVSQLKQQHAKEALDTLKHNAWAKFGKNHPDTELLNPLQVPIAIIGMKYDIFRKTVDAEKQRVVSSTLRFLAHINGASLMYCATTSENLMIRTRALLCSMAFGTQESRTVLLDDSKPLIAPAGADSLGAIGPPPMQDGGMKIHARKPVELWKNTFAGFFPPAAKEGEDKDGDPAADPQYAEAIVDEMRTQKDLELAKYKKATERAAREQERQAHASGKDVPQRTGGDRRHHPQQQHGAGKTTATARDRTTSSSSSSKERR